VRKKEDPGYVSFLEENGIKHHVVDMKGTKKETIPLELMRHILRIVLNKENYPLLIHCNRGRVRPTSAHSTTQPN
jgi:tyrosine-protein phosphatase SIW14